MHEFFRFESMKKKECLGGICHRWEDNIKMDVKGIVLEDVDWIRPDMFWESRWAFVKNCY